MNNPVTAISPIKLQYIGVFLVGFLIAMQIVQFFLIFLLYHYISNVEHRMDMTVRDSRREIIQMIGEKQ